MDGGDIAKLYKNPCGESSNYLLGLTSLVDANQLQFHLQLSSDFLLSNNEDRIKYDYYWDKPRGGVFGWLANLFVMPKVAWTDWKLIGHELGHVNDRIEHTGINRTFNCNDRPDFEKNAESYLQFMYTLYGISP